MSAPRIRVFVSYDRESDDDLYELLSQQASNGTSRFQISARSPARSTADSDTSQRRAIQEADQVIILCGVRSELSESMGVELRIAQEEQRPYLLLWGRRALMCTKPATARSADVMYSWTSEILERQLVLVLRGVAARKLTSVKAAQEAARPAGAGHASLAATAS